MVKIRIEYEGEVREMECQYLFGAGCVSETTEEINAASFLFGHASVKNIVSLIGSAVPNIVREKARDTTAAYIVLKMIENQIAEARTEMIRVKEHRQEDDAE